MQWHKAIENTVTGLGYDLVDVERAAHGLLRVTIDLAPAAAGASGAVAEPTVPEPPTAPAASEDAADEALPPAGITVEDCERVTRQLQLALEVEGLAYERLEVSSPGLDRPLRRESDFQRFAGAEVKLTLKLPFQGRKHWVGVLQPREGGWQLELTDGGAADRALDFVFDEVREARLVPVLDFRRGRAAKDERKQRRAGKAQKAQQQGQGGGSTRKARTATPANNGGQDQ